MPENPTNDPTESSPLPATERRPSLELSQETAARPKAQSLKRPAASGPAPRREKRPNLTLSRPSLDREAAARPARGAYFTQLILSTVNKLESAAKVRESLAFAYWARVVGPQAAAATEVEAVRDGVLFIRTKSSVWSHELTLHKERLITGLNRMLGGKVITEIVYKARGIKKKPAPVVEIDTPEQAELDAVILDAAEHAELQQNMRGLSAIKSDRIRQVMASRMTRDAKLRHWRIERNWKLCRRCATLHKTDFDLCPLCRLTG